MSKEENQGVETERCVMCNKDTGVPISLHIDLRYNYIEGAGQICKECAGKMDI